MAGQTFVKPEVGWGSGGGKLNQKWVGGAVAATKDDTCTIYMHK